MQQKGFTLLEIIVTIVILSISASALISAYSTVVKSSADPMLLQQSVSIAQSYMEKITLLTYDDPNDGGDSGGGSSPGVDSGESVESTFDDVDDYEGFTTTVFSNFNVDVDVDAESNLNGVSQTKKITVTVSHNAIGSFELISYKTYYDDSKTY